VKKYSTIFFDLDHTLWDFERNSREALSEIITDLNLASEGIDDPHRFIASYEEHNKRCWEQYRKGEITKENLRNLRFRLALQDFNADHPQLAERIGDEYVNRSPYKTHLFPGANEVLEYLATKYNLYLITNGFEEIQHIKIKESGLGNYFRSMITSERAGVRKPHPDIFKLAMEISHSKPEFCIMIGDDEEADVMAARKMNMDAVLFDPMKKTEPQSDYLIIHELIELKNHL
jgi:putative hydrolase of the HAD superfamily